MRIFFNGNVIRGAVKLLAAAFLIFNVFFSGCFKNKTSQSEIVLPETKKPLNFNQWAVVNNDLPKLRDVPDQAGTVINYLPLGTILKVIRKENELKKFDAELNYWYYVDYDGENGWIFGTFIEIYNDYLEAERKCEQILYKAKQKEKDEEGKKE